MANSLRTAAFLLLGASLLAGGCAGGGPEAARIFWPPPPDRPRLEFIGIYASESDIPKTKFQRWIDTLDGGAYLPSFENPFGIFSDGRGRIYVSDTWQKNVKVFDLNTKKVSNLLKKSTVDTPLGMATDTEGKLYIADGKSHRIMVFTPQGFPLFTFGGAGLLTRPEYLAINERFERIFISDRKDHSVAVFDLQGKHLFSFGEPGKREGELNGPRGLTFDGEDRLYVADTGNSRIQVFDANGHFLFTFNDSKEDASPTEPIDLAFDSAGHLYVLCRKNMALLTYAPEGRLLLATGASIPVNHKMALFHPTSIYIDPKDRIYIVDGWNKCFSIWQYLGDDYLKNHPIAEQETARLEEFIEDLKNLGSPLVFHDQGE